MELCLIVGSNYTAVIGSFIVNKSNVAYLLQCYFMLVRRDRRRDRDRDRDRNRDRDRDRDRRRRDDDRRRDRHDHRDRSRDSSRKDRTPSPSESELKAGSTMREVTETQ